MRSYTVVVLVAFLTACGKPAAPPPATVSSAPTRTPEPDVAVAADTAKAAELDVAAKAPSDAAVAVGDDLLVWISGATGRETLWLHGDEVVARRAEAVIVADGKLWALGERWRVLDQRPCNPDTMEGDPKAPVVKTALPSLVGKELGGATEIVISEPGRDAGDVWDGDFSADVTLVGSLGPDVFFSGGSSFYGCGAAHPDGGGSEGAFDLGKPAPVDVVTNDALDGKLAAALIADAKTRDCLEDGETIEPTAPSTLRLSFSGGKASAAWLANRGELEHARAYCAEDVVVPAPLDATLGYGPIDARLAAVIAGREGTGAFGLSTVPADKRDALLATFRREGATFTPKPELAVAAPADESAAALVAKGRKLTSAKDYAGAIGAFDQAVAKDAKLAAAWSGRGYAKLLARDPGAKADLEQALALDTKDAGFQAAVWFNLGQLAEAAKDRTAAKVAYGKADVLKPSDAAKRALARVSK